VAAPVVNNIVKRLVGEADAIDCPVEALTWIMAPQQNSATFPRHVTEV